MGLLGRENAPEARFRQEFRHPTAQTQSDPHRGTTDTQILPPQVAGQIATGEVFERPGSVVNLNPPHLSVVIEKGCNSMVWNSPKFPVSGGGRPKPSDARHQWWRPNVMASAAPSEFA